MSAETHWFCKVKEVVSKKFAASREMGDNISDLAITSPEERSMSGSRRGVVLSGLTQAIDLRVLRDTDPDFFFNEMPVDNNSTRLFSLYQIGSMNEIVAEFRRLNELFPGKYRPGTSIRAAPLRARETRLYLSLWDVIDYPVIQGFGDPLGGDLDYDLQLLIDEGLIVRSSVKIDCNDGLLKAVEQTHRAAYAARAAAEPSIWSMARDAHSLRWWDTDSYQGRGALVRLHDCIPIPDAEVPIQEILQFKDRRRAELLSLRHHLDCIYQRVSVAADRDLSLDTEVASLERSLSDYLRAGRASGMRLRMLNLDAQVKVEFDVRTGLAAGAAAFASGLPTFASVLAGIDGAFLPKFEVLGKSAPRDLKIASTPYEYVTKIRDELNR